MKTIINGVFRGLLYIAGGLIMVLAYIFEAIYMLIRIIRYGIARGLAWTMKVTDIKACHNEWNELIYKVAKRDCYDAADIYNLKIKSKD